MNPLKTWRGRLAAIALAAAAVAFVAATSFAAQPERPGRRAGRWMRGPMPFAQLNLSDDQKTRIRDIFARHREADQATMEELRTARQSLRKAMFGSATPDPAEVDRLADQVAELEGKALRARVAAELEVAPVLTDEQRAKMASMSGPGARRGPRR
jgi:Spy/CpxP family protein refolding chaperone